MSAGGPHESGAFCIVAIGTAQAAPGLASPSVATHSSAVDAIDDRSVANAIVGCKAP